MPTVAQIQKERKDLIREIRRRERETDTTLEQLERRLLRLIDRKTLITAAEMRGLMGYYSRFFAKVQAMEKAIADSAFSISAEF